MLGEMWCVRCFKGPHEPAGEKCGNPLWHTGHVCQPRVEGATACRWCAAPLEERKEE